LLMLCCLPLRGPLVSVALEGVSCREESVCVKTMSLLQIRLILFPNLMFLLTSLRYKGTNLFYIIIIITIIINVFSPIGYQVAVFW
jgi:hypothetical protein